MKLEGTPFSFEAILLIACPFILGALGVGDFAEF